ncbi:MAG TPA: diguanylate cyclase, partial [Marinobacter hydrocarbonoclasticus]|nr:diguanylate cyclase [Marinobacter nauticus]
MDPRERRSSPRQPIKLAAQIDAGSGEAWPCQIADFCAEGMFIRYSGETSGKIERAFARGSVTELVVRFRGLEGNRRYELHVSPVRRIDGAMGVHFTRPDSDAFNAMLQLCGSSGDQSRSSLRAPSERVQFVLHQCAKTVTRFIEPLMDACFVQTVDALRVAAQKAPNDQLANELMDASGQIQGRQRVLWHYMSRSLESPLKPEPKGAPGSVLSVVDKNEFEDWLAIRVMVTRADTQYRGDLLQLKLRLDKLGIANRTGHHNPLGPALVCEAFHNALAQLKVSREVEKVCLKTFEQTVIKQLEPLYRELNNILIRHGVLPDLDLSRYLSEQAPARKEPPAEVLKPEPETLLEKPQPEAPESKPGQTARGLKNRVAGEFRGYARAAQTAFATVRNLLTTLQASRVENGEATPEPFAANARPLSQGELHRELQELQLRAAAPEEPAVPLRDRVVGKIRETGDTRLNAEQQQTLDVVDRFFRSVVDSPKLSDYAQSRMRQLEVPVLKVVMRDPEFFEDQDSPVRGVMNRLAQLGVKGGRLNPVVQRRVDELIH